MLTLCVLLTARPGKEAALVEYEDRVLALLGAHGGRLLERVRSADGGTDPYEVHLIEFESEAALQSYLDDPVRAALADQRDAAIATTHLMRVTPIP